MIKKTSQENFWKNKFGDKYTLSGIQDILKELI